MLLLILFLTLIVFFQAHKITHRNHKKRSFSTSLTELERITKSKNARRNHKKPEWVTKDIIRLKALMPHAGCRKIADTFNRLNANSGASISKSTVYTIFIRHQYEIHCQRKNIRNRKPKPTPKNVTWSVDLTNLTCNGN